MFNKNNRNFKYSIRKYSVGVASVAVATFVFLTGSNEIKAAEVSSYNGSALLLGIDGTHGFEDKKTDNEVMIAKKESDNSSLAGAQGDSPKLKPTSEVIQQDKNENKNMAGDSRTLGKTEDGSVEVGVEATKDNVDLDKIAPENPKLIRNIEKENRSNESLNSIENSTQPSTSGEMSEEDKEASKKYLLDRLSKINFEESDRKELEEKINKAKTVDEFDLLDNEISIKIYEKGLFSPERKQESSKKTEDNTVEDKSDARVLLEEELMKTKKIFEERIKNSDLTESERKMLEDKLRDARRLSDFEELDNEISSILTGKEDPSLEKTPKVEGGKEKEEAPKEKTPKVEEGKEKEEAPKVEENKPKVEETPKLPDESGQGNDIRENNKNTNEDNQLELDIQKNFSEKLSEEFTYQRDKINKMKNLTVEERKKALNDLKIIAKDAFKELVNKKNKSEIDDLKQSIIKKLSNSLTTYKAYIEGLANEYINKLLEPFMPKSQDQESAEVLKYGRLLTEVRNIEKDYFSEIERINSKDDINKIREDFEKRIDSIIEKYRSLDKIEETDELVKELKSLKDEILELIAKGSSIAKKHNEVTKEFVSLQMNAISAIEKADSIIKDGNLSVRVLAEERTNLEQERDALSHFVEKNTKSNDTESLEKGKVDSTEKDNKELNAYKEKLVKSIKNLEEELQTVPDNAIIDAEYKKVEEDAKDAIKEANKVLKNEKATMVDIATQDSNIQEKISELKEEKDKAKLKKANKQKEEAPKVEKSKEKEEVPKVEEGKQKEETPKVEENKPKEESPKEEAPKVEEGKQKEETPKVEENKPKEETPKIEENKQKEEAPKVEENKPKEEAPKVEEGKQKEETPKVEENKPKEETPKIEENKPKEEAPKVEESKEKEETPKEEGKPKEEAPKVEESKPREEAPKVEESKEKEETPKEEGKPKEEAPKVEESKPKEESPKVEEGKQKEKVPKVEENKAKEETPKEESKPREEAPKVEESKEKEETPSNDTKEFEISGKNIRVQFKTKVDADEVKLKKVDNKKLEEKITDELLAKKVQLYDIKLMKKGKIVSINSERVVRIALANSENDVEVYYVKENGSLEKVDSKIENGEIVFKTNHFSIYAIVSNFNKVDENSKKIKKETQGDKKDLHRKNFENIVTSDKENKESGKFKNQLPKTSVKKEIQNVMAIFGLIIGLLVATVRFKLK